MKLFNYSSKIVFILSMILLLNCSENGDKKTTEIINHKFYPSGKIETTLETIDNKGIKQIMREYYEDSKLKSVSTLINGKLDGLSKSYYPNGILMREVFYENGKRNGIIKSYFPSGELRTMMSFKNDKPVGKAFFYYENQKIREYQIFNISGNRIFISKYDSTGKKSSSLLYPILEVKDTLKLGSPLEIEISFGCKINGKATLSIGKIENDIVDLIETVPMKDNKFYYKFYPKSKGNFLFEGIIEHLVDKEDSLNVNGLIIQKQYHVF